MGTDAKNCRVLPVLARELPLLELADAGVTKVDETDVAPALSLDVEAVLGSSNPNLSDICFLPEGMALDIRNAENSVCDKTVRWGTA